MHVMSKGRLFKAVSLDTGGDDERHELERVMRDRPTPLREARALVRTRNGNLVQAVAR